jgi:hypothetical protein
MLRLAFWAAFPSWGWLGIIGRRVGRIVVSRVGCKSREKSANQIFPSLALIHHVQNFLGHLSGRHQVEGLFIRQFDYFRQHPLNLGGLLHNPGFELMIQFLGNRGHREFTFAKLYTLIHRTGETGIVGNINFA